MKGICLIFGSMALVVAGCNGDWPASMSNQPSVDPLVMIRPAPEGSVPVGGVEHLEDREDDEDLTNPFPVTPALVARGRDLFTIHCVICHGPEGHGHGKIAKVFPPAPDLRHISICRRTDGFIYGTITAGGRAMPSLRAGLSSHDRWALVAFVRKVQSHGCITPNLGGPGGTP